MQDNKEGAEVTLSMNYYLTQAGFNFLNEFKAPSIRGTLAGAAARVGTKAINSSPRVSGRQDPSLRNNDLPSGFPSWTPAQNKEIGATVAGAKGRRATEIAGRFVGGSPHGTPLGARPGSGLAGRRRTSPWSTEPNTGSQGQIDTHRERDRETHKAINKSAKETADSPDPEKDSGYFQKNAFNRPSAANRSELDIERMRSSSQSKTAKLSSLLSRPERGDSNQGLLDKVVKNTPNPDHQTHTYRGPGDTIPARDTAKIRDKMRTLRTSDGRKLNPTESATAWRRMMGQETADGVDTRPGSSEQYKPTEAEMRQQADRKLALSTGADKVHRQHKNIMAKRDAKRDAIEKQASSDEKNRMAHVDKFDPNLLRQQQLDRVSDVMKRTKAAKDKINLNDLPNLTGGWHRGDTNRKLPSVDKTRPKAVRDPRMGPQHVYSRGIGDQLRNYYRNVIRRR